MLFRGERIFLRLGVSIFSYWVETQVLRPIEIYKKMNTSKEEERHNLFTAIEISVELRHGKV